MTSRSIIVRSHHIQTVLVHGPTRTVHYINPPHSTNSAGTVSRDKMTEIRELSELLNDQEALLQDAALALPHDFSRCTYNLGHIRQAVYLCLTCPEQRGICSACSIACHTEHEQIELFPKRHFRCDCPTTSIAHQCTLHPTPEPENVENRYDQNFNALFCRCKREYDARTERETMIQCLACEVCDLNS
jgi:E3 ubiquitin-protein ligase UBR7